MKSIRKTTAKTRKGVLKWLAEISPKNDVETLDASDAVAVHIHRHTGEIISWEFADGHIFLLPTLKLAA